MSNVTLFKQNFEEKILSDSAYYKLTNSKNNIYKVPVDFGDKISIIVPTYNRKEQLKECISSILSQTYSNFEIIIVDDGSTDGTGTFLKKNFRDTRIFYSVNKKNSGAGISRKNGYNMATGKYIIFCDDDDYFIDDNYFSDAVKIFQKKDVSLICSYSYVNFESENKYELSTVNFENLISVEEYLNNFQFKYIKPNSTFTAIFRKEILENGDFDKMKMVNDSSIYMRSLLSGGKVAVNQKIIGIYRVHSKNITFNLKPQFILENLDEKKAIYSLAVSRKILSNSKKWLYNQSTLTIKYFLNSSIPSLKNAKIVYKWFMKNVSYNPFYIVKFEGYRLYYKIKRSWK